MKKKKRISCVLLAARITASLKEWPPGDGRTLLSGLADSLIRQHKKGKRFASFDDRLRHEAWTKVMKMGNKSVTPSEG